MASVRIMEFSRIDVGIEDNPPYDVLLKESLSAKKMAGLTGRTNSVGYACIGVAESLRRLGKADEAIKEQSSALAYFNLN